MPRSFAVNPIGVEFDPDAWLAELRSGTPAADLLARKVDLPVSPVGPDGTLRVMASSSEAMRALELLELQSKEGPCLDCYASAKAVVGQDLAALKARWPRFAPQALAAGLGSVDALPMRLRGTVIGALNLFHAEAGRHGTDIGAAQALADIATIAILEPRSTLKVQVVNQLRQHALNSRVVIEQDKGVVAERQGLDIEQALTALRNHARNQNLRLVVLVEDVIGGHLVPAALDRTAPALRT